MEFNSQKINLNKIYKDLMSECYRTESLLKGMVIVFHSSREIWAVSM